MGTEQLIGILSGFPFLPDSTATQKTVSGVRPQSNGSQNVRSTWVPSLLNSIFLQGSRESKKEKPLPAFIES